MRYLNSFWTFLQKENLVKDNPVARIESLRIESTIKKAFSAQELEALRIACERPRDRAPVSYTHLEMDYEKIGPAVAQILQDEIDTAPEGLY